MGLHHENAHGRVLRGLDARKHLEMTKRDSHGSAIKLHVPAGFVDKAADNSDDGVATVYNVVYVTASADFTGATAGYTTVTGDSQSTTSIATPTPTPAASPSTQTANSDDSAAATSTAASTGSSKTQATTPTAASSSASSSASSVTSINNKSLFLNPPASATASSTTVLAAAVAGTPMSATRNPDSKIGTTDHGMTGGAKAGLAFGILIGFALVAGLLFFCWRRRKNPNAHEELNEKRTSSIFGGKAPEADNRTSVANSLRSTRTASTAPRLSLRPVTQFLPNLGENRKSAGNLLGIGGAAPMSEKPKSSWERRPVGTENPFEDNNEKQDRAVNPFDEPEGAVVAANGTRSSTNSNGSTHSKNGSAGSDSMTPKSDVAVVAAPVAPQGANNVHRVQLDFKPSMEDELELKSGQLVRMLHEYDDGWALCVRMDRSQQGVAPRTCLSKVPVKPRPQGPPNGQRGPPPPGMRGPGPRQGPGMVPRPLSPSSRERSGSVASERPQTSSSSGSNPSPTVARKPVPGQAL